VGATLYEMLTLKPAFPGERRADLIDRVRHEEPPRPRQLDARIPRDLETVVLKAMAKEPERRYLTASALAEDLRRYLADRPVLARRSTTVEQAWRWCRRNPTVAILTAFVVILLAVLLAGALASNAQLHVQLERAERAEKEKTDKLWDSYLASAQANRFSAKVGRRFAGLEAVRRAAAIRPDLRLRNEAIALFMLADIRIARELPDGLSEGSGALTFDPDFERYARSDAKGNISVRWVADEKEIVRLPGFGTHTWHMVFSPDGRFLAARYHIGGQLRVWDVAAKKVVLESPICGAADFSPIGNLVALTKADGFIHLVDLTTGQVAKRLPAGPKTPPWYNCAFDPHGRLLAVSSPQNCRVFDLNTGKLLRSLEQPGEAVWRAGGVQLALVNRDRITVWNTRTWTQQVVINTPDSNTDSACFNRGGDLLASRGWDETLQLWNPWTGQHLLSRHGATQALQFSRDGRRLAMTHEGARVQLWEVASPCGCRILAHPRASNQGTWVARFSPDGTLLASSGAGGMNLWDVATGCNVATLPSGPTTGAVFAADGKSVITRGSGGLLRWPVQADPAAAAGGLRIGPPQILLKTSPAQIPDTVCPGPDGKVALNVRDGKARILVMDPGDPANPTVVPAPNGTSQCLAASPDGRWIAAMSAAFEVPATLRVSDVRTGALAWSHPTRTPGEFSSDSRWLVTGGDACRIWETGTWRLEREIPTPAGLGTVYHATFSPDGSMLAIAYEGLVTRLVDARMGEELATLPSHAAKAVESVRFSPDGTQLACVNGVLGTQLWDLRRIRTELAELGLDWQLLSYPPRADDTPREPIHVHVVAADPTPPAPKQVVSAPNTALRNRLALWEFMVARTPYHPEPFHQRGHVREAMGQYREAVADFEAALAWQPGAAHLYYDRGRSYEALKDHARAIRDFDKAVALAPNYVHALNALAWLYVAGPPELRAPAKAVPLARRAVQLAAGNWSFRNTLGVALYRIGDFDQAAAVLESNSKDPKNVMTGYDLLFLALSHHRLGDHKTARSCYERAVAWQKQAHRTAPQLQEWNQLRAEADTLLAPASDR
jgi:eukaryotic-like serine/threonine-protein kinase